MGKLLKAVAWVLVSFAVISAVLAVIFFINPDPKNPDAGLGLVMFALMFGVPGGILLRALTRGDQDRALKTQLRGLLQTLDQFTVAELAAKLGKGEAETEQHLLRAVAEDRLDLVFHRPDARYMHRNRIRAAHQVYDRCGSCGASLQQELSIENEPIACPYCGSAVNVAARA